MARRGRPRHPDILTPREWDVLALLRERLTNEQIGERLGITERTAKFHVSEILSKLGASSREEAAAWQPEERPRWLSATALGALSRGGGKLVNTAGIAAVAVAAVALGVLIWGLSRSSGAGSAALPVVIDRPGVYLMQPDGSNLRQVAGGAGPYGAFAWAPEGDGFAFAPDCQAETELSLGSANDEAIEALATLPGAASSIEWSPGGEVLGVNLTEGEGIAAGALLVDAVSGAVTPFEGSASFLGWSYDGRRYARYDSGSGDTLDRQQIALVEVATGTVRRIDGTGVLWSPTDDRLAVTDVQAPDPPSTAWLASGIDVINGDGSGRTTVLPVEQHGITGFASAIAWSPDGRQLLVKPYTQPFRYLLYDVDAPEQAPQELGDAMKFSSGVWSPDGGTLVLERLDLPDVELYLEIMSMTEGGARTISLGEWTRGAMFSPDGRLLSFLVSRAGSKSQELYVTDPADASAEPALIASANDVLTINQFGWSADGEYLAFVAWEQDGGCA